MVRRAVESGGHIAYWRSVETCKNRKCCTVCGRRINRQDALVLEHLVGLHLVCGGGAVTYARTVSHTASESLAEVWDRLDATASALGRLTRWKNFRKRWGLVGDTWGVDCTHGSSGWHPHRHGVLLLEKPLERGDLDQFNAEFFACWEAAARKAGAGEVVSDANYCERLFDGVAAAKYVFKASSETLRMDTKEGSQEGGRTPFRILADFGETGLEDDLDLWHEWEDAGFGRKAKFFTAGLLDRYGLKEMTDAEAVQAEVDGVDIEHAILRRSIYLRLQRMPGGQLGAVLRHMAVGGCKAVLDLLLELGVWSYNSGDPPLAVLPPVAEEVPR